MICLQPKKMIFWFLLQFVCVIWAVSSVPGNETDRLSLLEFKAKIDSDPLGILRSWNESVQFCSWPGVTCGSRHQRVTALDVRSLQFKGQLSPHIGNLSFLRSLRLEHNGFRLGIPQEIGRLFRLQLLQLRNNSFSGEIPANISGCASLRIIALSTNNLAGKIPAEIGSLSELRILELSHNNLFGEIPSSIGNLSLLAEIYMGECSLQGHIPSSFGRLKSLRILVLHMNNLTGTIPISLYNVSTIEDISLLRNRLEGTLPLNFGLTLPNLRFFSIVENNFSGPIPASVSNTTRLFIFQIDFNNFTGKVPSFATPVNLRGLSFSSNNLGLAGNGDLDFLRDLANCTELKFLGFAYNNLGGAIPETLSNMTSTTLSRMEFGNNRISGDIPTGIGNLVNLDVLGFEFNQLTGPIPSTIGRLSRLNMLTFFSNKLSGTIPPSLRNLTSLSRLSLGRNNIQGIIPPSLGECRNLQSLSLAENNLSGSIPSEVFSLSSLSQRLDLSKNRLTGSIPVEVERLTSLGSLDVSENELSGEIPEAIGRCTSMEYLYLEGNLLQGSIPSEVDKLKGLQVLDLSRNNLSGQVPMYFEDFRGLLYLNLSFNEFEGQLPLLGVFENASRFSIAGNKRLCGGLPELNLPKCTSNLRKNKKLSAQIKLIIIVSCVVVGISVIVLLLLVTVRSRKQGELIKEQSIRISLPRVSYEDLSRATGGFSSENLIGSGGFGSVYKGILDQEKNPVAVKILNLDISRSLKSFVAECESLGGIRHRNIVKLLTVCSSIDLQGNDFKALVYDFMENGNLEDWLHSNDAMRQEKEKSHRLNLIQRINIAIDVACALDYLHNHGHESIAHCDIKPSNILLDDQMVAHVGDFGLAKLLKSVSSYSSHYEASSVGVRGTVGYVAPEYVMGGEASTLGDIYSFGILLLEIFVGKRPTDGMFKDDFSLRNFASVALPNRITDIMDPILVEGKEEQEIEIEEKTTEKSLLGCDIQDETVQSCLTSIIEIGVACSSSFPRDRRNMSDVHAALCQIRDTLKTRKKAKNYVK